MLFNSIEFLLLVGTTFLLFYTPFLKRFQTEILIASSFFFYAYSEPLLLLLLVSSVCINIVTSQKTNTTASIKTARLWATCGVVINLAILGFFKYSGLLASTFLGNNPDGEGVAHFIAMIPLPIGISFFTFQGISLLVDTFTQTAQEIPQPKNNIPAKNTALFISFFPQLVAGPIVKSHEFIPQISPKSFGNIDWQTCFQNLVTGYFLKVFVADNLKEFTYWIEFPYFSEKHSIELLVMLFGFSMQIFADFAGYSLIAIGIAGLFGYKLPINFNFPYIARSFSEFWRRWHISLSTWLRDYLYIPLGGNRKGSGRTYFNLFLVMFLGGLWHGASWSFAVWGTAHGLFLAVERLISRGITLNTKITLPAFLTSFIDFLKMIFIFTCVTFAWLLFKLPDFTHVTDYITCIAQNTSKSLQIAPLWYVFFFSLPVIVYHLNALSRSKSYSLSIPAMRPIIYGFMLFLLITEPGSQSEFIYFQF